MQASFDMPFLSDREVEAMAREYGFIDCDEEKVGEKVAEMEGDRKRSASARSDSDRTLQIHDEQEGGFRND